MRSVHICVLWVVTILQAPACLERNYLVSQLQCTLLCQHINPCLCNTVRTSSKHWPFGSNAAEVHDAAFAAGQMCYGSLQPP